MSQGMRPLPRRVQESAQEQHDWCTARTLMQDNRISALVLKGQQMLSNDMKGPKPAHL